MIENWPSRHRRLLAVGLLFFCGLAIETLIRVPLAEQRRDYQSDIATKQTLAERYRRNLDGIEADIARTSALANDPALIASFLDGEDDGLAVAALQRLIKTAAAEEDLEPQSLRVLPVIVADNVRRISVAIDLETTDEPLISFIHSLEGNQPLVRVDALEVQTLDEDDPTLKVSLEAHGLVPETPL